MDQNVIYVFGAFRLNTDTQLLCYEGGANLQPKVYQLLLYLLQHPGRLIAREELFNAVWSRRVVEDTSLRLAINTLRKALQDESKTPSYILTVCKRGYRFLPEVTLEAGLQDSTKQLPMLGLQNRRKSDHQIAEPVFEAEFTALQHAYAQVNGG
jgi:DNA-binding winged helix-turn-helix (wHTH) protein